MGREPKFKVGDRVVVSLEGARFASCTECPARWVVIGCDPVCPECGAPGVLGRHVTPEDLGSEGPPPD